MDIALQAAAAADSFLVPTRPKIRPLYYVRYYRYIFACFVYTTKHMLLRVYLVWIRTLLKRSTTWADANPFSAESLDPQEYVSGFPDHLDPRREINFVTFVFNHLNILLQLHKWLFLAV